MESSKLGRRQILYIQVESVGQAKPFLCPQRRSGNMLPGKGGKGCGLARARTPLGRMRLILMQAASTKRAIPAAGNTGERQSK